MNCIATGCVNEARPGRDTCSGRCQRSVSMTVSSAMKTATQKANNLQRQREEASADWTASMREAFRERVRRIVP